MPALALVLALLLAGEAAASLLALPVPGAALGLAALAAWFATHAGPTRGMEALFDAIAPNAPLLFVPAAAGIVANLDLLGRVWLAALTAVAAGTAVVLVVAGLCAQALMAGRGARA